MRHDSFPPEGMGDSSLNTGNMEDNVSQGKYPFKWANFKKNDIKMVNDAANQVGVDRKMFGNYIHELKKDFGMRANENFTYQELVEFAEDLLNMMK